MDPQHKWLVVRYVSDGDCALQPCYLIKNKIIVQGRCRRAEDAAIVLQTVGPSNIAS
jgi:hypothetical protein